MIVENFCKTGHQEMNMIFFLNNLIYIFNGQLEIEAPDRISGHIQFSRAKSKSGGGIIIYPFNVLNLLEFLQELKKESGERE